MASNGTTKDWKATQAFEADAKAAQEILEAAAKAIGRLRFDDDTLNGFRTQRDLDAINTVLGHAQVLCEAVRPLDGGQLVRQVL